MIKTSFSQQGFTLVETLVAISILLLAIMDPMTIAAKGLQGAFFAREQLTAVFLAQEGIEFIRTKRDEYALEEQGTTNDAWLSDVAASCKTATGCGIDVRTNTFITCGATGVACRLLYDSDALDDGDAGMYTYVTGAPSPFTRIIRISGDDDEAIVNVTVSWQAGLTGGTRSVELESYIFNQYDSY